MALTISSVVESKVRIHCGDNLMVVHWILSLGQTKLDELLGNRALSKVPDFPTLSFSQPSLESGSF